MIKKPTQKAGTILINLEKKEICLIKKNNKYSFPKGHLEENETLIECAIRETREETMRDSYVLNSNDYIIGSYITPNGEKVECYFYIAIDLGYTNAFINDFDKEEYEWISFNEVEDLLSFSNLKEIWNNVKDRINNYFDNYSDNINYKNDYYKFNNLNIKHGFFIKPYDFNINIVSKEKLTNELNIIKKIMNVDKISLVKQEHTSIIKKVTLNNYNIQDVADGMITNIPNIILATKIADCQAIFLYDSNKKVIGNIHSGWKGTIEKIVGKAVNIMINEYECNINDIKVYINPSIGKCHFEVDYDVYEKFINSFKKIDINKYIESRNNKYYIDTKLINKAYLMYLGILEENIFISNICTVCNGDFVHSYRYDKENSGRNLAIISL